MNLRYSLTELGDLAVEQIGFCIGISWRSALGAVDCWSSTVSSQPHET